MQGTSVSERAVPVALFGKEVGIAHFFSFVHDKSFEFRLVILEYCFVQLITGLTRTILFP